MSPARILSFCLPCLVAAFTAAPAQCSMIAQYSDPSQFQANATVSADVTFGQLLPGGDNSYCYIGGSSNPQCKSNDGLGTVIIDGVTFLGAGNPLEAYSPNDQSWYNFNTGDSSPVGFLGTVPGVSTPEIQINLTGLGVTAFGLDLMSIGSTAPYNINVDGTNYTSLSTQVAPTVVFFGGTFTTPISTITLTMPTISGEVELIDDFQFGTATAQQEGESGDAPEAATMVLIGSGLIGLTWLRRRAA